MIQKAMSHIQRDGLISFVKQLFKFLKNKIFLYQNHYIFQKKMDELKEPEIKAKDFNLRVISTEEQLFDLFKNGFNINSPFDIKDFEKKISLGQILFCVFIGKDLAHSSWVVMSNNIKIHPPLNIKYQQEAFIHYCITAPEYRGIGLYPYTLSKIFEFLERNGKSTAKLTIQKNNISSIKGATKVGCEVCGEGEFLKLFGRTFWKEKSI